MPPGRPRGDPPRAARRRAGHRDAAGKEHVVPGRRRAPEAVTLGIHLGMSGKIVIADAGRDRGRRRRLLGGRPPPGRLPLGPLHPDLRPTAAASMLVDPRRLGRVRLNPPVERLGPDAQLITPAQFRAALAGHPCPAKARLMDAGADRRRTQAAGR